MKLYRLDFGWEVSFPDSWISETDEFGVCSFYPPNDTTTAYASVFHAEKEGVPAPIEVLEGVFMRALPRNIEEIPFSAGDLVCKAYFSKDDDGVFRIDAGLFAEGDLLILNVYSESEAAVRNALEYFKTVSRR